VLRYTGVIGMRVSNCSEIWPIPFSGTPVYLNTCAVSVSPRSVTLEGGATISAKAVVVATEGPVAQRLLDLPTVTSRAAGCVYFAAHSAPVQGNYIVLDGHGQGPVLNVAVMSNVSSAYAPHG